MLHLLRPSNASLTSAMLLKLLKPAFSPDAGPQPAQKKRKSMPVLLSMCVK